MLVSEARKACPELVVVDGEDLTPFRDVSKILFNYFKSYSWNNKVERLGLDEVFMGMFARRSTTLDFSAKPPPCC